MIQVSYSGHLSHPPTNKQQGEAEAHYVGDAEVAYYALATRGLQDGVLPQGEIGTSALEGNLWMV